MHRPAVRECAVLVLFLILAVAMTWPLVASLDRAVRDPGDPYFSTWVLDWDYHATFGKASLWNANILHPARRALAFSEHTFGIAVLFFPLFAAGVAPITIHNLAILLGFALCGYTMYLLARHVTGSTAAAIAGGIAFAFVGFRFHHLPHLPYVWSIWLPLLLLALLVYAKRPTWRNAALFGAVFLMNGLSTLHFLLFGALAAAVTALVVVPVRRWLPLGMATILAMLALWPFLAPYRAVQEEYGMRRDYLDAAGASAEWGDWLEPYVQSKVYGKYAADEKAGHERTLFPGFVMLAFAVAGAVHAFRARHLAPLIWVAIGALGARGVHGFLHSFLFEHVSGFRGIRMPIRWAIIAYVGLALLAAIGAARLRRRWAIALVAALMLVELRAAPIRYYMLPLDPRPVYAWLRDTPIRGAILELPVAEENSEYEYVWRATVHHKPLVNGVSGYVTKDFEALVALVRQEPIPGTLLDRLEAIDCSVVVVHAGLLRYRGAAIRDWLKRGIASGRLAFVRRFDEGAKGAYVFALTRIEPQHARWRAPEVPDPAGRTPSENARLFLENEGWTYSAAPFVIAGTPPRGTIRGPLTIEGAAFAPEGIRAVNVRLASDRVVVPAQLFAHEQLSATFPWYPKTTRPGFRVELPAPPRAARGQTFAQIEVIDGRGVATRFPGYFFTWYDRLPPDTRWRDDELSALLIRLGGTAGDVAKVKDGRAAVEDFIGLEEIGDPLKETNLAFIERAGALVLGHPPPRAFISRFLARIDRGVSRRRVLEEMLLVLGEDQRRVRPAEAE